MRRAYNMLAAAVLTGFFAGLIFVAIAALDEFARLPFYDTLPVAALAVNASAIIVLCQKRADLQVVDRLRAQFASTGTRLYSRRANRPETTFNQNVTGSAGRLSPSEQDIEAALGKVHSVAWGYPAKNVTINVRTGEAVANHEARR
jgi:hypothetical protein